MAKISTLPARLNIIVPEPHGDVVNFGYDTGDWRVDRHPHFLADVTGEGCADIIGFGDEGVLVHLM